MSYWTILNAQGQVVCPCFEGAAAPASGPWGATGSSVAIAARPDAAVQKWTGTAWVDDPVKVEAYLLAKVKDEAEDRKMNAMTVGGAKKAEYAAKRAEVNAWDSLGSTATATLVAFNSIVSVRRSVLFAYAIADAAAFGDTPVDAINRFRVGMSGSNMTTAICAIEAKACAAIRAAATASAKRAVYSAINWSWTP